MVSIEKPSIWERLMTVGWITAIGAPLVYLAIFPDPSITNLLLGALIMLILGCGLFMISAYFAIISLTRGIIELNEDIVKIMNEHKMSGK